MFSFMSTGLFAKFHRTLPSPWLFTFVVIRSSLHAANTSFHLQSIYTLNVLRQPVATSKIWTKICTQKRAPLQAIISEKKRTISENWLLGCQLGPGCQIKCRAATHHGISPWLMTYECPAQVQALYTLTSISGREQFSQKQHNMASILVTFISKL